MTDKNFRKHSVEGERWVATPFVWANYLFEYDVYKPAQNSRVVLSYRSSIGEGVKERPKTEPPFNLQKKLKLQKKTGTRITKPPWGSKK